MGVTLHEGNVFRKIDGLSLLSLLLQSNFQVKCVNSGPVSQARRPRLVTARDNTLM